MLKAVIFDLDGVITDTACYHFQAWREIAQMLDIEFDEEYNEKLKGASRLESLNLILDRGVGRDYFPEIEKKVLMDKKNERYKELITQITKKDLLPGIEELLITLRNNGVKTGLASVSKNAGFIINQLGVADMFDYVADAHVITRSKPEPDLFLDCLQGLGVSAEESVGIEDAELGIEAIHRAGMKAVGVGSPEQMKKAELILKGTKELNLELLEELVR